MTYFLDGSRYSFLKSRSTRRGANVGWLDQALLFPTGPTSLEFRQKLQLLCQDTRVVNKCKGCHTCQFCERQGVPPARGNGELRIDADGWLYVAPQMIAHYVEAHHYKPPSDFVNAVLAASIPGEKP